MICKYYIMLPKEKGYCHLKEESQQEQSEIISYERLGLKHFICPSDALTDANGHNICYKIKVEE